MISLFTLSIVGHAEVPVIDQRLLTHKDCPKADDQSVGPAALAEDEVIALAPEQISKGQQELKTSDSQ